MKPALPLRNRLHTPPLLQTLCPIGPNCTSGQAQSRDLLHPEADIGIDHVIRPPIAVLEEVRIAFEVLEHHVQQTIWDTRSGLDPKRRPCGLDSNTKPPPMTPAIVLKATRRRGRLKYS